MKGSNRPVIIAVAALVAMGALLWAAALYRMPDVEQAARTKGLTTAATPRPAPTYAPVLTALPAEIQAQFDYPAELLVFRKYVYEWFRK